VTPAEDSRNRDTQVAVSFLDGGVHRVQVGPGLGLRDTDGDEVFAVGQRRQVPFLGRARPEHIDRPRCGHVQRVEIRRRVRTDTADGVVEQQRLELRESRTAVLLVDVDPEKTPVGEQLQVLPWRLPVPLVGPLGELVFGEVRGGLDKHPLFVRERNHWPVHCYQRVRSCPGGIEERPETQPP
jgi:hypothetical protein